MLDVVLVAPEIAANTGNAIRLCANAGAVLHLVEPLGFRLDDRHLRRAGLDYHELAEVRVHAELGACFGALGVAPAGGGGRGGARRAFALSGRGARPYDAVRYGPGDVVVFGAERAGLDAGVLDRFPPDRHLRIPMRAGNRSLNLANAIAVVVFEAWRQHGFAGAAGAGGDGAGGLAETPSSPPFDA